MFDYFDNKRFQSRSSVGRSAGQIFPLLFILRSYYIKGSQLEPSYGKFIKKANKLVYFLILLCRAHIPPKDIVNFYCTGVRSILEYCSPVFHHVLPKYLQENIERVTKRALHIISPEKNVNLLGSFKSCSCSNGNEMYKKVCCTCKVLLCFNI